MRVIAELPIASRTGSLKPGRKLRRRAKAETGSGGWRLQIGRTAIAPTPGTFTAIGRAAGMVGLLPFLRDSRVAPHQTGAVHPGDCGNWVGAKVVPAVVAA